MNKHQTTFGCPKNLKNNIRIYLKWGNDTNKNMNNIQGLFY